MMCPILGADNDKAKGYAADLGIAMQLTNIKRDDFGTHGRIKKIFHN